MLILSRRLCCCGDTGGGGPGFEICPPCCYPKVDLRISFGINPSQVPPGDSTDGGSYKLTYNPTLNNWGGAAAVAAAFDFARVSCQFLDTYTEISGGCVSSAGDWALVDATCQPFHLHYQAPNTSVMSEDCSCLQDAGGFCGATSNPPFYLDVWIDLWDNFDAGYGYDVSCPCEIDTIHVRGCNDGDLSGIDIEIRDGDGTTVDGGTTDDGGNFQPSVSGGPFSVIVSGTRFDTATFSTFIGCNGGESAVITLDMSEHVASDYICAANCVKPVAKTLHATHPLFGALTFVYNGSGDHGAGWYVTASYSYPGCGDCSALTVTVECYLNLDLVFQEFWHSD